jgi:putative iron-regulated protein
MNVVAPLAFAFAAMLAAQAEPLLDARDPLLAAVVARHAEFCASQHALAAERAATLQQAIAVFLQSPDEGRLAAARMAWCSAREAYGPLEALRFHGGPIDAIEPLLNAWPVDEAYIDQVAGRPTAGIVHDTATFQVLSAPALLHANERGGEANISVGWHAIEFLLWGQDQNPDGPGQRPASDFLAPAPAAERRRSYLQIIAALQAQHLRELADAWAPAAPFRRQLVAEPLDGLRRMLTGVMILTAFELAGERLAVAYETKDQEQEHSCFSDTTCADLLHNQRGIVAVLAGPDASVADASVLALLRRADAAIAEHLAASLAATTKALAAIPAPFDRACLGADDAPGRIAVHAAITALEQQAEAIAIAGRRLGFDLPVRPGN